MIKTDVMGIGMTSQRTRSRLIDRLRDEGIRDSAVLDTLFHVPRHLFIDEAMSHRAYEDSALPIGMGQTISQPLIVASMTELLISAKPLKNVLEVGTGCGYQTAVLANVVAQVWTVERIKVLQEKAKQRLSMLKINNVRYRYGDGWQGWSEAGPFDGIIVTAAPETVPETLTRQLDPQGGRMIIPVGKNRGVQNLLLIERNGDELNEQIISQVKFVPLLKGELE